MFYNDLANTYINTGLILQGESRILFSLLKKEIAATMMKSFNGISPDISDWKGQEITDFQEDLISKVKGRLSEKWFYTHMKSLNPSMPRIDMLNILSQYAGYKNWNDFKFQHQEHIQSIEKVSKSPNLLIRIPLMFLIIMIILLVIIKLFNTQNYRLTFIDSDTGDTIINSNIQADLLLDDESPMSYISDKSGNIVIRTNQRKITFVIKTPYYLTDTVTRVLKKFNHSEQIKLSPDSYALMIYFFSQTDVLSWEKRRYQLSRIISEDAMIYQIPDKQELTGMELYNKPEFIDKLTMPSASLSKIEVLDCRYQDGQIVTLRFRIKAN